MHGSGLQPAEMGAIDAQWKLVLADAVADRCAEDAGVERFAGAYVATKDPAMLAQVQEYASNISLPLVTDAVVHRYGKGFSTEDLVKGNLNRTQEALDAFSDVDILSRCSGACSRASLFLYIYRPPVRFFVRSQFATLRAISTGADHRGWSSHWHRFFCALLTYSSCWPIFAVFLGTFESNLSRLVVEVAYVAGAWLLLCALLTSSGHAVLVTANTIIVRRSTITICRRWASAR